MSVREHNYDLLRALSMLAVVLLHVSGVWTSGFTSAVAAGDVSALRFAQFACVVNSLVRFAVPCFLMLSGAFLLGNPKNVDYRAFYRKSLHRIVVPVAVFSVLYIAYGLVLALCFGEGSVGNTLLNAVRGAPSYHMWYMYMLVVIYLFVPVMIRFKDSVSPRAFAACSAAFLVIAMLCRWVDGDPWANWDVAQAFEYSSYLLVGYAIRRGAKKSRRGAVLCLCAGMALLLCMAYVQYSCQVMTGGNAPGIFSKGIVEPYCLPIVGASVLVFAGFAKLGSSQGNRVIDMLSRLSFTVYLIHPLMLDFLKRAWLLCGMPLSSTNCVLGILLSFAVVLAVSLVFAVLYERTSTALRALWGRH